MKYNGIGMPLFDMCCKISRAISLKFSVDHIDCHIQKIDGWLYITSQFVTQLAKLIESYENK